MFFAFTGAYTVAIVFFGLLLLFALMGSIGRYLDDLKWRKTTPEQREAQRNYEKYKLQQLQAEVKEMRRCKSPSIYYNN